MSAQKGKGANDDISLIFDSPDLDKLICKNFSWGPYVVDDFDLY